MPDILLGSGSAFELASSSVQSLLNRYKGIDFETLTREDLVRFEQRDFKKGWLIKYLPNTPDSCNFLLLIDNRFPYSKFYSALTSDDGYLRLPHVEEQGVLCTSIEGYEALEDRFNEIIKNSVSLIADLKKNSFVDQEFKREFLSYWNRSLNGAKVLVNLNLNSEIQRVVYFSKFKKSIGNKFTIESIIGETKQDIEKWIESQCSDSKESSKNHKKVLFFFGKEPVIPPYPERTQDFFEYLQKQHSGIFKYTGKFSIDENLGFLIATRLPEGVGLVYFEITKPNRDGFPKNGKKNLFPIKYTKIPNTNIWTRGNKLIRRSIERVDAAWVHNRDKDPIIHKMTHKHVLILGCGSIGSQVAFRLGQSGVGKISIVDPEILAAANVGRHTLGIPSIFSKKSESMASMLSTQFPHATFTGYPKSWQRHLSEEVDFLEDVDLIVSCMGDWAAEGMLNEFLIAREIHKPIVYGWIGEGGTTAHAVSFFGNKPNLSCIIDNNGSLKKPEIILDEPTMMLSEPACGTMFQPYGAIDAAHAEILVSRLCIDILSERSEKPVHRVYACSDYQVTESKQKWSDEHLKYRPDNFSHAFEYEKENLPCGQCMGCKS